MKTAFEKPFVSGKKFLKFIILQSLDYLAIKEPRLPREKTLLLVRLDAIGDYILFRNFLEIIRNSHRYKDYNITLCGNRAWQDLAETFDNKFVNDFIWIDKKIFIRNIGYRYGVLTDISQRGFEVAIQPNLSREFYFGDAVIRASGAQERIGSSGDLANMEVWQKKISDRYYTKLIPVDNDNLLEFLRNKEFFEKLLGIKIALFKPNINLNHFEGGKSPTGNYAIIFPGASNELRRWSTDKFAEIAEYLSDKYGLKILIAGSHLEKKFSNKIIYEARNTDINDITGMTTLSEITKLISQADLVVSNDTSAAHLAVAVNTKIVYLLAGNLLGRFGPYPNNMAKAYYIYPKEIMEKLDSDFDYLTEKFRYESDLDVNSIKVEEVKRLIDEAMKNQ
jgi:ADP-heptose:LPS heptosyltransferase